MAVKAVPKFSVVQEREGRPYLVEAGLNQLDITPEGKVVLQDQEGSPYSDQKERTEKEITESERTVPPSASWGTTVPRTREELAEFIGRLSDHQRVFDVAGGDGQASLLVAKGGQDPLVVLSELRQESIRRAYENFSTADLQLLNLMDSASIASEDPVDSPQTAPSDAGSFMIIEHDLIDEMPFSRELFDVTVLKSVAHLLSEEELDQTLSELKKTLNSDGKIYLTFTHPEFLTMLHAREHGQGQEENLVEPPELDERVPLSHFQSQAPYIRPLEWYERKFKEHGLAVSRTRSLTMNDLGEDVVLLEGTELDGDKPFYFMYELKK